MFTPEARVPGFARISNKKAIAAGLKFRSLESSIKDDWLSFKENYPANYDLAANGTGMTLQREAELPAYKRKQSNTGKPSLKEAGTIYSESI
jgi:hypothetical protein